MIKNEKEYRTTRAAVAAYEDALSKFDILRSIESGVDPLIAHAQRDSYERQIDELNAQIEAYDSIKEGRATEFHVSAIGDLGQALISARIAAGLTQREFAGLAGIKEQQVQRYEKEGYNSANIKRLEYLSRVLGLSFSAELKISNQRAGDVKEYVSAVDVGNFPLSEMNANGWLAQKLDLRRASGEEKRRALASFFARAGMTAPSAAMHRKTASNRSVSRDAALLVWQARVLTLAKSKTGLARRYKPLEPDTIRALVTLSNRPTGHLEAVDMLLQHGIILVFVPHLKGTKLDGAAMSLDGKYAVIGMTTRYDRIDNFWFVLLHELGHVTRHWGPLLREGFIDEGDDVADSREDEANDFAATAIVSTETWNASFVRFTKSPDVVRDFANRIGVHPALIAGRIRKERGYKEFQDLLGSGEIRASLKQAGLLE